MPTPGERKAEIVQHVFLSFCSAYKTRPGSQKHSVSKTAGFDYDSWLPAAIAVTILIQK